MLLLIGKIAIGLTIAALAAAASSKVGQRPEASPKSNDKLFIAAIAVAAAIAFAAYQYKEMRAGEIATQQKKERAAEIAERSRVAREERQRQESERASRKAVEPPIPVRALNKPGRSGGNCRWRKINGGPVCIEN